MSEAKFTKAIIIGGGMTGKTIDLLGVKDPVYMRIFGPDNVEREYRPKIWASGKDGLVKTLLFVASDISDEQLLDLVKQDISVFRLLSASE